MKRCLLLGCFFAIWIPVKAQTYKARVQTNLGTITVMLYDDTPKHRDAFLKLADNQYFDGTLFYRSVKNFVVQAGSSDSRNAPRGKHIGYGTAIPIDAEFVKKRYHKFGALCAPRQPEQVNHFKSSDVSQFYIVTGKVYTPQELDQLERTHNNPIKKEIKDTYLTPFIEELNQLKTTNPEAYNSKARGIKETMQIQYQLSDKLEFSPEQRHHYTTIGGTPDLDGSYTVFGEVIDGFDVLKKIAALPTDANDRPLTDVILKVTWLPVQK